MENDRRGNPRFHFQALIRFRLGEREFSSKTQDASSGGFFVQTDHTPPIGTVLQFELEIPGSISQLLRITGQVRHIVPTGMGIKIKRILAGSEPAFEAYQTCVLELGRGKR